MADWDSWLVSRYADVLPALRDQRLSSARMRSFIEALSRADQVEFRPLADFLGLFLGMSDAPDHTRVKRVAIDGFGMAALEALRPRVQAIADGLIDELVERRDGRMDVIRDFATPLPAFVIAEVLGLQPEDLGLFRRWADDVVSFIGATTFSLDRARLALGSLTALLAYFDDHGGARAALASDLTRPMRHGIEQGVISETEFLATCATLLSGGQKTTTNLIGNGTLALIEHPDQLRLAKTLPAPPGMIDELLRFDPPVPRAWRRAREDFELDGRAIKEGQTVLLLLGSACHDLDAFADGDQLDLTRKPNRHLAFGFGPHLCIGAPLARMEAEIAFSTLLARVESFELDPRSVSWLDGDLALAHRGLSTLPVGVTYT